MNTPIYYKNKECVWNPNTQKLVRVSLWCKLKRFLKEVFKQ